MALICVNCGEENPGTNRFCGQCGRQLERAEDVAVNSASDAGSSIAIVGAPASSGAVQPRHEFDLSLAGQNTAGTGVHGPSFLGLSEDEIFYYEDEEHKPPSHLRRNIAIAGLVVALALIAWQWQSIADSSQYVLASVQYAFRKAQPASAAAGNPLVVAADSASRVPAPPPATPKAQPLPQTGNLRESPPPAAATKRAADEVTPRAMSAPAAIPNRPSPAANQPDKLRTAHPESSSSPTPPGAYEMERAAKASDADVRVAWLWNAVSKGNPQASVELAKIYVQGSGVVRNCEQAQVLLRGAAAKGNEEAKQGLQQIRIQGGCVLR